MSLPVETVSLSSLLESHERLLSVRLNLDSALNTLEGFRTEIGCRLGLQQHRSHSSSINRLMSVGDNHPNQARLSVNSFQSCRDDEPAVLNGSSSSQTPLFMRRQPQHPIDKDQPELNGIEESLYQFRSDDGKKDIESFMERRETERRQIAKLKRVKHQLGLRIKYTRVKIKHKRLLFNDLQQAVDSLTISDSFVRYSNALHQRSSVLVCARDIIVQDLKKYRRRLIDQLGKIFPIKSTDEVYTMRGFDIPSVKEFITRLVTMSSNDFWVVGTSLGFAAHFTHLLAKYLDIPLPRQIGLFSSRSTLRAPSPSASLANLSMVVLNYNPPTTSTQASTTRPDSAATGSTQQQRKGDGYSPSPSSSPSGTLQLLNVLQYAERYHEQHSTTLSSSIMNDNTTTIAPPTLLQPTLNVSDANALPFPITVVDSCFRCRPDTAPSQEFTSALTQTSSSDQLTASRRSLKLSTGLLWIESQSSMQKTSQRSRYYNAIHSTQPPPWAARLKSQVLSQQMVTSSSHPSSATEHERHFQSESSASDEIQFTQTPRGPRRMQQPPQTPPPSTVTSRQSLLPVPSTPPSHLTTSSALPFPQLISVGKTQPTDSSTSTPTITSYDPISLTLSLFGFSSSNPIMQGGGNVTTRPGLMDEIDPTEAPLFVKSNALLDRQRFITGLRELNYVIRQLAWAYNERPQQHDDDDDDELHGLSSFPTTTTEIPQGFKVTEYTTSSNSTTLLENTSLLQPIAHILESQRVQYNTDKEH